jgi:hypothetical protein
VLAATSSPSSPSSSSGSTRCSSSRSRRAESKYIASTSERPRAPVRRGSTVRVRQRPSSFRLLRRCFRCLRWRWPRVSARRAGDRRAPVRRARAVAPVDHRQARADVHLSRRKSRVRVSSVTKCLQISLSMLLALTPRRAGTTRNGRRSRRRKPDLVHIHKERHANSAGPGSLGHVKRAGAEAIGDGRPKSPFTHRHDLHRLGDARRPARCTKMSPRTRRLFSAISMTARVRHWCGDSAKLLWNDVRGERRLSPC